MHSPVELLGAMGRTESHFGFINLSAERLAASLFEWQEELNPTKLRKREIAGVARDFLGALSATDSHQLSRDLVVGTQSSWTALFDSAKLSDPRSALAHLGRVTDSSWLLVGIAPFSPISPPEDQLGFVQFLYSPDPHGDPRIVDLVENSIGPRYTFETDGPVQPFENTAAYSARLKRDRFTFDMLSDYCKALGIDVFNPEFYSGPAYVVERTIKREGFGRFLRR